MTKRVSTTIKSPDSQELQRLRDGRIFVAGHRGMVGSAIVRRLEAAGCENLILRTRTELDLTEGDEEP